MTTATAEIPPGMRLTGDEAPTKKRGRKKPVSLDLDLAAEEIKAAHASVGASLKAGLQAAQRAGELLTMVRKTLPKKAKDGEKGFPAWVKDACGFSYRSARYYMFIWKNREKLTDDDTYNGALSRLARARHRGDLDVQPQKKNDGRGRPKSLTLDTVTAAAKKHRIKVSDTALRNFLADLGVKLKD